MLEGKVPRQTLIVVPNWLGDAILALPAIEALISHYHESKFVVVAPSGLAELFIHHPGIKDVVGLDRGIGRLTALGLKLRGGSFQLAVIFPNSFRSALIPWLAGVPYRAGYRADCRSLLLTHPLARRNGWQREHQSRYYSALVAALGARVSAAPARIYLGAEDERWAEEVLTQAGFWGKPLALINPGAAYGPAKRWFPSRYTELGGRLVKELGAKVVVVGGRQDEYLAKSIAQDIGPGAISLAGRTSLLQLAALSRLARAFVTNDTGPMHVAAAAGASVIAVFGSTDPGKSAPLGHHVIIREPLPCSPCFKRSCPYGYECFQAIGAERVLEAVSRFFVKH